MRGPRRRNCHVDRAACAWLIRSFIDADAEFVFVDDVDEVPADATPFDMRGVELSHHHGDCSFETILRRYELNDPVLWRLPRLVHAGGLPAERHCAPRDARRRHREACQPLRRRGRAEPRGSVSAGG